MALHGFADIRSFRVRLPVPLYPYPGRDSVEAFLASDVSRDDAGWLSASDLVQFFPARFSEKNPLNVPGPIYGAETDTCCTGPHEAPNNVLLDKNGQEFVFRQASTPDEFRDLVSAAICECFEGYGADGDFHWRLSTIREWWQVREDMLREEIDAQWCNGESLLRWKRSLQGEGEAYLRVYAFFVENGRVPGDYDFLPKVS
jgi:hypothetical protein